MGGLTVFSCSEDLKNGSCSFVWDENSQLYYHASSGFYHDPVAGWYYSSGDGSYYKFENGSYVLLQLGEAGKCKTHHEELSDNPVKGESCRQVCGTYNDGYSSSEASELDIHKREGGENLELGETESINAPAVDNPPPTSLWLEDTLIDLFLSGYSNPEGMATGDNISLATGDNISSFTISDANHLQSSSDGGCDDTRRRIEGECSQDESHGLVNSGEGVPDGGAPLDEDNWKAQYGQVTNYGEETNPKFSVVDMWDWSTVCESRTNGKGKVTRLVGRLARKSAKLHPSVSFNSVFLKTSPICEVHLNLVRVETGKIYKLHSPSKRYLASISAYDSSNPTKGWGFQNLLDRQDRPCDMNGRANDTEVANISIHASKSADELHKFEKHSSQNPYRDRAAERRSLHGAFSIGPGQKKKSASCHSDLPSTSGNPEDDAAEALHASFGAGSYSRKILESMGWKEGEGLGNSTKGLLEPIKAVGNIGNAGLGFPTPNRKRHI